MNADTLPLSEEMNIEVTANKEDGSITFVHDQPLYDGLRAVICSTNSGEIFFQYKDHERAYGAPIAQDFAPFFESAKHVTLIEIHPHNHHAVGGAEVPLILRKGG